MKPPFLKEYLHLMEKTGPVELDMDALILYLKLRYYRLKLSYELIEDGVPGGRENAEAKLKGRMGELEKLMSTLCDDKLADESRKMVKDKSYLKFLKGEVTAWWENLEG